MPLMINELKQCGKDFFGVGVHVAYGHKILNYSNKISK